MELTTNNYPEYIKRLDQITDLDHKERAELRDLIGKQFEKGRSSETMNSQNEAYQRVRGIMASEKLFDVTQEPQKVRDRYGPTQFAEQTLIARRRPFKRSADLSRLPMDNLLYLSCQLEILVGYAFGRMILQADLNPCVGRRDIRVMPRRLRKVPDRVNHHKGALPAIGAVFLANPAVFEVPVRQLAFEACFDLGIRVGALFATFRHRDHLV